MKRNEDPGSQAELDSVGGRLRRARPVVDETEAERLVSRVSARFPARQQPSSLRARFALFAMLVFGFALSGGGVGLAVSGLGSPGATAAQDEYGGGDGQGVLGENESGGNGATDCPASAASVQATISCPGDGGSGGSGSGGGTGSASDPVQADRQVSIESGSTGSELPFTGAAAIPMIVLGLGLLLGGFLLRRRTA